MASSAESEDAVDGEEITNKSRKFNEGRRTFECETKANHELHEMCLIHLEFKHFHAGKAEEFRQSCKVSSIMWAKVLSIMLIEGRPVTAD